MGHSYKLEAALSRLGPVDKEIILLRHIQQLTNDEAAGVLLVPPATASKLYVRAVRRLKTRYEDSTSASFQPFDAISGITGLESSAWAHISE